MSCENYEIKFGPLETLHNEVHHRYCPGCEHGTLTRLIARALSRMGLKETSIGVASVGCSVTAYDYYNIDHIQVMHGRAPAVCTGIKRARPDCTVFTVQGDGDALAIGLGETISAAVRGEPITVFLVNNGIYGMTGGQMAPTTHPGMWSTTTPYGRDIEHTGQPTMICEMLKEIANASYVRRVSAIIEEKKTGKGTIWSAKNILTTAKAIEHAFTVQKMGGFAFLEILTTCAVNWKKGVLDSKRWGVENHVRMFPPALYRDDFGIEQKLHPLVPAPEGSLALRKKQDVMIPIRSQQTKTGISKPGLSDSENSCSEGGSGVDQAACSSYGVAFLKERLREASMPLGKLKQDGVLKIMISGHGGQGVLDLGNFIAYQAVKDGEHVVYTPTYGPESRGGKVRCWVTTSEGEISSPMAEVLDVLLIMNKPSMDFVTQLRPGGLLLYNISIIDREVGRDDITAIPIPCTYLAANLGEGMEPDYAKKIDTTKALNCIMYGSFLSHIGWDIQTALHETENTFKYFYEGNKARFIPLNIAAVKKGFEFLKNGPP